MAEWQAFGQDFRQKRTAHGGFHKGSTAGEFASFFVFGPLGHAHSDFGGEFHHIGVECALHFTNVSKHQAFTFAVDTLAGGVVQAQHHVLRRHDGGFAVGREQHIVRGQHQSAGFHLRFH